MKKLISKLIVCTLIVSLFAQPVTVFAWNQTGHQVIAAIAWDNLTETAKMNIMKIMQEAPDDSDLLSFFDPDNPNAEKSYFMGASYWPDVVRDRDVRARWEKYHKGPWHYVGTYWKETENGPVDTDGFVDKEHVIERIEHFRQTLIDPDVSDSDKAVQVAWILHLIGDIHMPLHNTSRVTDETPDGDRGGNSFSLGDGWPWNLHAFWDGIIDVVSPKTDEEDAHDYYLRHAQKIMSKYPKSEFGALISLQDAVIWNKEGKEITKNKVYPNTLKQGEKPSEVYTETSHEIAMKRMALSGYRMAEFLNQIFG